jgi:uncharacterized protein
MAYLAQIILGEAGALQLDREFALIDQQDRVVNGKRSPEIHKIRSSFDLPARTVTLHIAPLPPEGEAQAEKTKIFQVPQTFHLDSDRASLEQWFSDYFGYPIRLKQNRQMGFPDDTDASGPTVISTATLQTVADWFGSGLEEIRQRFRTNLEISEVPAFWEDQLYTLSGEGIGFRVGAAQFKSNNSCQRCVVPTRHPQTGDRDPNFQKQFIAYRAATLPDRIPRSRFDHFFRLALNTKVNASEHNKRIQIGDEVIVSAS